MLDLYHMDDSQETQLRKSYALAETHLAEMEAQRDELNEAIAELKDQMAWGARRLAELGRDSAAG